MYLRRDKVSVGRRLAPGIANKIRVENLSVGKYHYSVYGKGVARRHGEVTITAGREATLRIDLVAVVYREITISYPSGSQGTLSVSITDATGKKLWGRSKLDTRSLPRPFKTKVRLAPGRYTLRA